MGHEEHIATRACYFGATAYNLTILRIGASLLRTDITRKKINSKSCSFAQVKSTR